MVCAIFHRLPLLVLQLLVFLPGMRAVPRHLRNGRQQPPLARRLFRRQTRAEAVTADEQRDVDQIARLPPVAEHSVNAVGARDLTCLPDEVHHRVREPASCRSAVPAAPVAPATQLSAATEAADRAAGSGSLSRAFRLVFAGRVCRCPANLTASAAAGSTRTRPIAHWNSARAQNSQARTFRSRKQSSLLHRLLPQTVFRLRLRLHLHLHLHLCRRSFFVFLLHFSVHFSECSRERLQRSARRRVSSSRRRMRSRRTRRAT